MGKRKSAQSRAPRRIQEKLDTEFRCPFCNHQSSVEVRMDRKQWRGKLSCRVCLVHFESPINSLSDPIDVYTDWIDECERVNGGASKPPPAPTPTFDDALNNCDSRFS